MMDAVILAAVEPEKIMKNAGVNVRRADTLPLKVLVGGRKPTNIRARVKIDPVATDGGTLLGIRVKHRSDPIRVKG